MDCADVDITLFVVLEKTTQHTESFTDVKKTFFKPFFQKETFGNHWKELEKALSCVENGPAASL